ncbi:LOW QUALITY PROTEIN: solute carrier family 35 member C2 [Phaethornis superciliosus]
MAGRRFPFPMLASFLHRLLIFGLLALPRGLASCRSVRLRAALSWPDRIRRARERALSCSLDIALSNWSFLYVTSLYTMTKSSAILLILFSLLFKLVEVRVMLVVVLLIAGGLFMFTYKSRQFNPQWFVLVLYASFLGDIHWIIMQILMQKAELVMSGLQNLINLIFHLQPLMFLVLFPLFVVFEGLLLSISEKLFCFHEVGMLFFLVGKLFLGGILAFVLGFERLLVSRTPNLTLSIAGIFKEIILFLTMCLLGDHLSLLNWLGFAICLSGISLHGILKAMNSKGPNSKAQYQRLLQMLDGIFSE